MATFAKASFSAAGYATFRPTYPQKIFDTILAYHSGPTTTLLDLGTGHGTIPRTLSNTFTQIHATDPSPSMLTQAKSQTPQTNITYRQGTSSDLSFLSDNSLDMVTAGQSAHWFNYPLTWPSLSSKLRTGGTLAFIGYKDPLFPSHARASKLLDFYSYSPIKLGPFWEPGRQIVRDLLSSVVPPPEDFEDVRRVIYEPSVVGEEGGDAKGEGKEIEKGELLFGKRLKLGEVEGYMRTFSSYVNWKEDNATKKGTENQRDLVDDLMEEIVKSEEEWVKLGEGWREAEVDVEWGSVILLARRK